MSSIRFIHFYTQRLEPFEHLELIEQKVDHQQLIVTAVVQ